MPWPQTSEVRPRFPAPGRPLRPFEPDRHLRVLAAGTILYRCYRRAGAHPSAWNRFRSFGPTGARFDHHLPPPREQDRAILYAATDLPTALVEAFNATGVIDRHLDEPWLASFRLRRAVRLLDLSGPWPIWAAPSQVLNSSPWPRARLWAQAIHEDYPTVEGLIYPSSMAGRPGFNLALSERARGSLSPHPTLHLALSHPGLATAIAEVAELFGYGLI